jgi:hypothetical protein
MRPITEEAEWFDLSKWFQPYRPMLPVASAQLSDRCRAGCRRCGGEPKEGPLPSLANECSVS